MAFQIIGFCLIFSLPKKLENSIFETPIIPQTLKINNLITTRAKSINILTLRLLIKYCLKMCPERQHLLLLFFRF